MSKVLIIANSSEGLIQFRKELLIALREQKHDVFVSVPRDELFEEIEPLGCTVIETEMSRRGTNPIKDIRLLCKYYTICKKVRPDIVFTYTIKPNIYGGIVCQWLRLPYIVNITGLGTAIENKGFLHQLTIEMYRIGIKNAQKVFFQNQSNLAFMLEKKVVSENYEVLPGSGVNLQYHCFEEYPSEDEGIRFLFVGRIMKDKGIEEYLYCAKQIHEMHPECSFDIVGDYDDESYRPAIEQSELEGCVKAFGNQKDVHSFIKSHHILIQPSYHEGLSNVLLEAAACGRPVLASNIPGCKETFDEEISGIGFSPRNGDSLVASVEKILSISSDERERMGLCGRKKVEREFSRQIVIDAYLKELRFITQRS